MAFKIMNRDELELLTEEQRAQYEKELNLYRKREAFVERLEQLETVQLEPYEPKLKPVTVLEEMEVRPFAKAEYTVSLCPPVQKPELQIISFEKAGQVTPVLPDVSGRTVLPDRHVKRMEKRRPVMPTVGEVKIPVAPFRETEKPRADVPDIAAPVVGRIPAALPEISGIGLPDVTVAAPGVKTFLRPEGQETKLPFVPVPHMEGKCAEGIKDAVKLFRPDLPEVSVIRLNIRAEFDRPETEKNDLPRIPDINVPEKSFSRLKQQTVELPQKPEFGVYERGFSMPKLHHSGLPKAPDIPRQAREFTVPEWEKPDLPMVSRPAAVYASFEKTENRQAVLPDLPRLSVYQSDFKNPEKRIPDLAAPAVPRIAVKVFSGLKRNVPVLPEIQLGEAPDAYREFEGLLAAADRNRNFRG